MPRKTTTLELREGDELNIQYWKSHFVSSNSKNQDCSLTDSFDSFFTNRLHLKYEK